MKKLTLLLMAVVLLPLSMFAQKKVLEGIPLIDRQTFFDTPEISGGKLSPDGKYISFMKEYNGITNIWVKKFNEDFKDACPLTNNERPIGGYFWTKDSKYILYVKDNKGDENYNIYAVDPHAKAEKETGVPVSKNLSPMKDVRVQIHQVSEKNPDILWIGINDRDKAWHDLYKLTISTGKLELLYKNTNRITGWDFDWDEKARIAYRTDENGNSQLLRIDDDNKFTKIYETNVKEQAWIAGWSKDNTKVYLISNKGDVDLTTLYQMDPKTLEIKKLESDPKNRADFGGMFQHKKTKEIIYTLYLYDKTPDIYWKNKEWEKEYKFLQSKFPGREIGYSSFTDDYSQFLLSISGDKYVSETYYYNRKTKELIYQYTPRPKLKKVEKYLVAMEPVFYKSSDGMEIPAYLTTPYGVEAKNLPLVVMPHGGPKGPRDYWGYNSYAQMLANRGYAVLLPNFRASGGYGKDFLNAGDKQWGKLMQDDITWGVKYLVDKGIADKNRIAIMGGSYGGYATLAGLAFTPDVYACGVDIVGPSNLFTLLESIPPYWEAGRKRLYEMVGDPNTEEGKKLMHDASPLFSVDKIKKPFLIVQGANDPRVKQAESDQIVVAVRESGKDVEYILADDEGHGFRKPVNNMAMWAAIEKFLAKHIGGRYQESMKEDVAKRLKEITQDVSKVAYTPAKEVSIAKELPAFKDDLKAATYNYKTNIEVQGQKINMDVTRTIEQKDGMWVITEASKSPMGEAKDVIYIKDMKPVKREISQAGQNITMRFEKGKVITSMMGKEMPTDYEGAFLADGPGFDMFIARLPLAEDYKTNFQTLDLMTQKLKTMNLEVLGKEDGLCKIKVYNNANEKEETIYYINHDKKMATKTVSTVPMMGNAKVTVTLQ